jgi:ComF family protein
MRARVDQWWRRLGAQLLPPRCVLCGAAGAGERDLCASCQAELPRNQPACRRCALPLAVGAARCGDCLKQPPAFTSACVPYRYAWPLDTLVQRLKFGAELAVGRVLGELLGEAVLAQPRPDLLVPVPLGRQRLVERGFNQAEELAHGVARRLAMPCAAGALRRTRETAAQSALQRAARRRNVRGAFVADAIVRGRHVALLDDVVTTAATVRECARVLRAAGAASVTLWALARAGR